MALRLAIQETKRAIEFQGYAASTRKFIKEHWDDSTEWKRIAEARHREEISKQARTGPGHLCVHDAGGHASELAGTVRLDPLDGIRHGQHSGGEGDTPDITEIQGNG